MNMEASQFRSLLLAISVGFSIGALAFLSKALIGDTAAISLSLALGFACTLYFGRKWHHETLRNLHRQTEKLKAITSLSGMMKDQPIYWSEHAFAPETLSLIMHLLQCLEPKRILELGSGISTLFVSAYLKNRPGTSLRSFDDNQRWADITQSRLQERNLAGNHVQVRAGPLVAIEVQGQKHQWYPIDPLPAGETYDFIIVDGPPSWHGDGLARLPTLYQLSPSMTEKSVLVLDDAHREWESEVAKRWQRDFPHLHFRKVDIGRGLLVVSASKSVFDLLPP